MGRAHEIRVCMWNYWGQKKTIKGGRIQIRRQCLQCGKNQGTALKRTEFTQEQFDKLPFWDDGLEPSYREFRNEQYEKLRTQAEAEARAVWEKSYRAYLNSSEWKAKRQQVLERDQYRCQGCLNTRATQVHHLTYDNVGDELLFQLISVCDACHDRLHNNIH